MVLKVYVDLMSQPCRALIIFLELNKIPYEQVTLQLRKGEHQTDEFAAINRFRKVPAIVDDDGFRLSESIAIFRYLKRKHPSLIADHWYPAALKGRARVDEYMEWQHLNTRIMSAMPFLLKVMGQLPADDPKLAEAVDRMESMLDLLEEHFIIIDKDEQQQQQQFINGMSDISLADLLAVTELEQPLAAGYDICQNRPKLEAYMRKVRERVGPGLYDEVHKFPHILGRKMRKSKL